MDLETIKDLVLWLGGTGITSAAISVWVTNLVADRIKFKWSREANLELEEIKRSSNKEIEGLKGDISKNNSIINGLLTQQGQAYQKVLEKKIDAVQRVWEAVLKLKSIVPSAVSLTYNLYSDEELEQNIISKRKGAVDLEKLIVEISMIDFSKAYSEIELESKKLRPFISDNLALLLFVYGAILGRGVFCLTQNYLGEGIKGWRKDVHSKQMLELVLEKKELDYLFNKIHLGSFDAVRDILETKIINEMNTILLGNAHSEDTIKRVELWSKALKSESIDRTII